MTDIPLPWRAGHNGTGYSAEFLPAGMRTWRMLRRGGKPIIYATRPEAMKAAQAAYLRSVDGDSRASLPMDPERIAAKLTGEREDWLRVNRAPPVVMRHPGKKAVSVFKGRARA